MKGLAAAAAVAAALGGTALAKEGDMSKGEYTWEWPAGREPERKALVRIDSVAPVKGGFLGIGRSPSIGAGHPDPTEVRGRLLPEDGNSTEAPFEIRMPKAETDDVEAGDIAAIAFADEATVICFAVVPSDVGEAGAREWLWNWRCATD